MDEQPETYVSKYYTVGPEETLLFDATELRNGMEVVAGDPGDREDPLSVISGSELRTYEITHYNLKVKNRFCTISRVRVYDDYNHIPQVSFIATYEDGMQVKRTHRLSAPWIVKNDSIPTAEETLRNYARSDVEATQRMSEALFGPLDKLELDLILGAKIYTPVKNAMFGELSPSEADREKVLVVVGRILKIIDSNVEVYRRTARPKLFDFDAKDGSGGHVWVDPLPTGKFSAMLNDQTVWANEHKPLSKFGSSLIDRKNYPLPEKDEDLDGPKTEVAILDTQVEIKKGTPFGQKEIEELKPFLIEAEAEVLPILYVNYKRLFPNGGHNCRELGCTMNITKTITSSRHYEIKHVPAPLNDFYGDEADLHLMKVRELLDQPEKPIDRSTKKRTDKNAEPGA